MLRKFWSCHLRAELPLTVWYDRVVGAKWENFADVKKTFNSADLVGDRIVFSIKGNDYRLIAHVAYGPYYLVLIKFIGTYKEYDKINPGPV